MSSRPLSALSRPLSALLRSPGLRSLHSSYPDVLPPSSYLGEVLRTVAHHPQRPAIIDASSDERLSYSALQEAVLRFGGFLRLRPTPRYVGVFLDNGPDFVIACYGALAAGSTAVPVVSARSSLELQPLLAPAELVVTSPDRLALVRSSVPLGTAICLSASSQDRSRALGCCSFAAILESDRGPDLDSFSAVRGDDVAVLLSSSGTTGPPKKVPLSHSNLGVNLRQARALREEYDVTARHVMLGVLPLGHSNGLTNVLGAALHVGGSLVLLREFRERAFLAAIERYRVTVLNLVTPLVLRLLESETAREFDLSSLQLVLCGGAPLSADLQAALQSKLESFNPQVLVAQGYGLTEASPVTHMWPARTRIADIQQKMGSVGVLAPSTECRVVDPQSRDDLGAGASGELLIRGPQIMKSYFGNEAATRETLEGAGWLRTGDIGHFDDEGFFFISDRIKDLIKFKGFQVSPAELESVLISHPGVLDCAVVGRPDVRAGELPAAFVVPRDRPPSAQQLQDLIASCLADHKQLRGGVVFVDSLPRSAAGKLLRRELAESWR